jgi:prolyl-tRNA synthetase
MVIPILYKGSEGEVIEVCKDITDKLKKEGIRAEVDLREGITPGFKYYDSELKGVPIRIDIGPKEVKERTVMIVRRDNLEKISCKSDDLLIMVNRVMADVMDSLKKRSWEWLLSHRHRVGSIKEGEEKIRRIGGVVEVPYCGVDDCGMKLQEKMGIKVLGKPLDSIEKVSGSCLICGKSAEGILRLAKTY